MDDRRRVLLEALVTEREGMIAENNQRMHLRQSIAYGDEVFNELARDMRGCWANEEERFI
jgi:hypothetical protein